MKAKRKKILILSPIFPLPLKSGGQVRIFNLIKHLSDDFEISLLSLIDMEEEKYIHEMMPLCSRIETIPVKLCDNEFLKVVSLVKPSQILRTLKRGLQWAFGTPFHICRFYHPELLKKLDERVGNDRYDVVHAIYSQMAPYLIRAMTLDRNVKSILDDIDLFFVAKYRDYLTRKGLASVFHFLEYKRIRDYVAKTWPCFDGITVMSMKDKEKLLALNPDLNVSVVPNGVDTDYFRPLNHSGNNRKLVFVGGSRHYPNVDALSYFCENIFPLVRQEMKDVSLTVIGEFSRNLIPKGDHEIQFTGYVEDIRPHLKDCSLNIVPLRIGGGTRLKILEAMALGIPTVSTSIGCEGIEADKDREIIIADDPQEFAKSIKAILGDEVLHQTLARNGRDLVEQKYSWSQIVRKLGESYLGSEVSRGKV
jgi:glycosyltransferase involved in cell wall biosynthesis